MAVTNTSSSPQEPVSSAPHVVSETGSHLSSLDLMQILKRQIWLVAACVSIGLSAAVQYFMHAEVWHESMAKVLVSQKDPRISGQSERSDEMLDEDVLANHMELVRSRRIVEAALRRDRLYDLPSIQEHLEEGDDEVEYVISHLKLTKGGEGSARTARSLNIAFQHTNPVDAQKVLISIVLEYQKALGDQLEEVMSGADLLIRELQEDIEQELQIVQQEYVAARKSAPVLFQGEGSSNIFLDKYRRLQDELMEAEIQQSSINTRLLKVNEALESAEEEMKNPVELLALIDSESLERLGVFASLQFNQSTIMLGAAERSEQARNSFTRRLELMSEEQRLSDEFGAGHPKVQAIQNEIRLVEKFLADQKSESDSGMLETGEISPKTLLQAYVGFLKHDLAALAEKRLELEVLAKAAEVQAKTLVEFELQDEMLRGKIDRQTQLYDGVVDQLRDLDMATGLSGFVYELLEAPRVGEKVWPKLNLCGIGGILMGLVAGLFAAVVNDRMDNRFRSAAEIDQAVGIPIIGRVGRLRAAKGGERSGSVIAGELSPEGEAFRLMRTVLFQDVKSKKLQVLSISSPMAGDGKSTVVANLSAAFSHLDISVLLIDADMRRPTSHEFLGASVAGGLSEILQGDLDPLDAVKKTDVKKLSLITAGSAVKNPAELLQSDRFDELIATLRDHFDLIIIDSGPVLAVSDPIVISRKADGSILVVRTSNDTKDQVRDAVNRLRAVGANLLGCVVNTFGSGQEFSNEGGYYGYYESSYTRHVRADERNGSSVPAKANVTERIAD